MRNEELGISNFKPNNNLAAFGSIPNFSFLIPNYSDVQRS